MLAGPTLPAGDWRILVLTKSLRMVLASFHLKIQAAMVMFKPSYCGFLPRFSVSGGWLSNNIFGVSCLQLQFCVY